MQFFREKINLLHRFYNTVCCVCAKFEYEIKMYYLSSWNVLSVVNEVIGFIIIHPAKTTVKKAKRLS